MDDKSFLKMVSEEHDFSPSEGFSYALDQDGEFDEVTFFLVSATPNYLLQIM